MKVWLIGTGCGVATLTRQAAAALEQAELLIGAKRLLETVSGCRCRTAAEYRPRAVLELLEKEAPERACILLSGDAGFYSGAAGLLPLLQDRGYDVEVLPGISSLQYFAAKLQRPWQDWQLCSAHGAACDAVYAVMQGNPVFFLTSGSDGPGTLCGALTEAGLGDIPVTVGESLGLPGERITSCIAAECAGISYASLNVLLAEPAPVYPRRTPGIPDEEFLRDKIPMTKQEVRAAALSKLAVGPEDVCWDVGAGTGSVSVELALQARQVWAAEQKPEALELARKNRERFLAWNLHLVEGTAPEVLESFPKPDAVFVGGSDGHLEEILTKIDQTNPEAGICVSAIALETLQKAARTLGAQGRQVEITQIAVSRAEAAGTLHLMKAQNPVFLITGVRT